jgi:hypothetical protein
MNLPKHKCGLYLTHNQHKDYYETVQDRLSHPALDDDDYFVSAEDKQKCIDTDEIWELQWYPDTPVGFYKVCGSTLEIVLNKALEQDDE